MYSQSMFRAKIGKKTKKNRQKIFIFTAVKSHCILHGRVFIMVHHLHNSFTVSLLLRFILFVILLWHSLGLPYIDDIQTFLLNMAFISSSEVIKMLMFMSGKATNEIYIFFHFTSEIKAIFNENHLKFLFILYTSTTISAKRYVYFSLSSYLSFLVLSLDHA